MSRVRTVVAVAVLGLGTFSCGRHVATTETAIEVTEQAATVPAGVMDASVATGLTSPTSLALLPDGRIFVAQQNGQLKVIVNDVLQATNFITLDATGSQTSDTIDDIYSSVERGFLGVTVDPNFATNGYVYLYFTA